LLTVVLIIYMVTAIKLGISLHREKEALINNGIGIKPVTTIFIFIMLSLIPIFALAFPLKEIRLLISPYPIGAILFIPLIILTSKYTKLLDRRGTDVAEQISRNIGNIMWLGYGGIIILFSSWVFSWFISASWLH